MVGDAASSLASNLGDAASNLGPATQFFGHQRRKVVVVFGGKKTSLADMSRGIQPLSWNVAAVVLSTINIPDG